MNPNQITAIGGGPDGGRVSGAVVSKWSKGSGGPAGDEMYNMVAYAQDVAPTLNAGGNETGGHRFPGTTVDTADSLISFDWQAGDGGSDKSFRGGSRSYIVDKPGRVRSLSASKVPAVAHAIQAGALRENPESGPDGVGVREGVAYTLEARAEVQAVASSYAVRRLTPRECERLQGFPDDFTLIPVGKNMAADGPRYRALGNSMAVNVMRWIGTRIQMVDEIEKGSDW